eukprot:CAMPEP_0181384820 /NCGR_PEP_ID=MMETSP1106-20121128/22194_1 /TAXON_ID=81844 /ORGANISM="Mantoniella antarctica, Strain SL-175" /LENGTH=90 /DNA_ID=CAMNT_0023504767 /DNA_START=17 /DNA_END=286 /DNA_ORIENTATION=+
MTEHHLHLQLPEPIFVPSTPAPVLELVDVWVARVDKRLCNVVLKEACSRAPLSGLLHVKRVKRSAAPPGSGDDEFLRVLLCERGDATPVD